MTLRQSPTSETDLRKYLDLTKNGRVLLSIYDMFRGNIPSKYSLHGDDTTPYNPDSTYDNILVSSLEAYIGGTGYVISADFHKQYADEDKYYLSIHYEYDDHESPCVGLYIKGDLTVEFTYDNDSWKQPSPEVFLHVGNDLKFIYEMIKQATSNVN